MRQPLDILARPSPLPAVQRVGLDRPFAWLRAGGNDLRANPVPSIAYGLLFSIGGDLILLGSLGETYLFMTALSGFFLLAPLLAAGLYELSRQRAAGAQPTFVDSLRGLRRGALPIALFGAMLALVCIFWERVSALAFGLAGDMDGGIGQVMHLLASGQHRAFMAIWLVLGALLALLIFAFSVVSVPMMLDRDIDFVGTILTSLRAFSANLEAMVLWAAIIVALTLLGFATFLVGLVLVMPLLGHASWHAYRELVK